MSQPLFLLKGTVLTNNSQLQVEPSHVFSTYDLHTAQYADICLEDAILFVLLDIAFQLGLQLSHALLALG